MLGHVPFRVLVTIALRNLLSHKVTSLIVGSIILAGTALVVVGTALLDSMEASMARSITQSVAGHLQVYSASARDKLALFGGGFMGEEDLGEMREFDRVRAAIATHPNVAAVVPMGIQFVQVATGNVLDENSEVLRAAVERNDADGAAVALAQIRAVAQDLRAEYETRLPLSTNVDEIKGQIADLERLLSPRFEGELASDAVAALMFIDTKIAGLYEQAQFIGLRNLGTDIGLFSRTFDRFRLTRGELVPQGERGILLARRVLEDQLKNRVARELDKLKEGRDLQGKTIADDPILADKARQLPAQYRRVTFELAADRVHDVEKALRDGLKLPDANLQTLVQALLKVDDANLDARYRLFYDHVAPNMNLYTVNVGDTITLRSFTKSGYMKSVAVKVFGEFTFEGLESSDLAGAQNLLDLVTFRELYGVMTEEKKKELAALKAQVALGDVDRESAEASLFGGDAATGTIERDATTKSFDEFGGADLGAERRRALEARGAQYTQEEVDRGLALNAAILLRDPTKLRETQAELEQVAKQAGLEVNVVDWQTASGIIGQLITIVRVVLYIAIAIIFLVALVIINNSMVMATMERVAEIGTMRAIGAQRSFVMMLFLVETVVLGFLAGTAGGLTGVGAVALMNKVGIPAANDILVFLFSGPRLHPTLGVANVVIGMVTVLFVSLASTLYPARIATGIQPVIAMQTKE